MTLVDNAKPSKQLSDQECLYTVHYFISVKAKLQLSECLLMYYFLKGFFMLFTTPGSSPQTHASRSYAHPSRLPFHLAQMSHLHLQNQKEAPSCLSTRLNTKVSPANTVCGDRMLLNSAVDHSNSFYIRCRDRSLYMLTVPRHWFNTKSIFRDFTSVSGWRNIVAISRQFCSSRVIFTKSCQCRAKQGEKCQYINGIWCIWLS